MLRSVVDPRWATTLAAYSDQAWMRQDFARYTCLGSREAGRHSKVISFALGDGTTLGAGVISGVKVRQAIDGVEVEKSYSPISHPEAVGSFDLLVKAYPPRPGGGLGAWLCALKPGDSASIKVKPQRPILGAPMHRNRFRKIGALVGGTGVAPVLNLISTLLMDREDVTTIALIASHTTEADALCVDELEALASSRHDFDLLTTFTRQPPVVGSHSRAAGHIDVHAARSLLPPPSEPGICIFVCGSDDFLAAMAGPIARTRDLQTGSKHKVQGPTLGLLGDLGYGPHQVMKL